MSDNIPFEIQVEIMKRLPVKSLIQFRSVSKQWKSLIDASEFITNYHHHNQTQHHHHLLVRYADPQDTSDRILYLSIVDDDTFPQNKVPLTVPLSIQQLHMPPVLYNMPNILGSSQGLFCFYNFLDKPLMNIAVIWNPAIRKSVDVVVPNVSDSKHYYTVLGFGVCLDTNDPKLVKATLASCRYLSGFVNGFWEVEVFTLSSGVWRSLEASNLPTNMTGLIEGDTLVIDGFIYWHAYDMIMVDGNRELFHLIMSFDLKSEEFTKIYLPDSLAIRGIGAGLSISKLRDSLVVLQSSYKDHVSLFSCGVWMMENGDPKSLTKIFTITPPPDDFVRMVLGFSKSGETIIEVIEEENDALCVYEHDSEHINHWFSGKKFSLFASCYMETLLLLDHRGHSI